MNGNLWVIEQLVASRADDLRRAADASRRPATRRRPTPSVSVRLGQFLIRTGRRLAGPEHASPAPSASAGVTAGPSIIC